MRQYRGLVGPGVIVLLVVAGMLWSPFEPHGPPVGFAEPFTPEPTWAEEDWDVFSSKVRWAGLMRVP